jgi:hypothetical protein
MTADVDHLLKDVISDVAELKEWLDRHERRHNADQELLSSIVDTLTDHQTNHHGRASTVRQTISIGAVLATLTAIAEVIRQFLL